MTPDTLIACAINPAMGLLPARMDTNKARAMLLTIAMQESRIGYRRQLGGPARSYWQFELVGVNGVLTHPNSRYYASEICDALDVRAYSVSIHTAIEFQDVLACAFARLLLWTLPSNLPNRDEEEAAWLQYIAAWRPGRPRRESWDDFYRQAWQIVEPE